MLPPWFRLGDPRIPLLERIWSVYGDFTDIQLLRFVCNGPMNGIREKAEGYRFATIPDTWLRDEFRAMSNSSSAN